jgi:chromosome segregation ATPase
LRAERDSLSKELDLLKADRDKWTSERESMSLAHRKLHSELYVTRTDLATTRADLEAAQERLKILDECQAKCERLEHALQDVEISYSWRVTKPIRELMVFLRKGPRSR